MARPPIVLLCDGCGALFERREADHNQRVATGRTRVFCTWNCYKENAKAERNFICEHCQEQFVSRESDAQFCGHSCAAIFHNAKRKIVRPCKGCGESLPSGNRVYCSQDCKEQHRLGQWLSGETVSTTGWCSLPAFIRRYLLELANDQCPKCQWKEIHPVTGKVPLEINHINGDGCDNRFENLEVLCPNCHSLTPNFRALNQTSTRKLRKNKERPNP